VTGTGGEAEFAQRFAASLAGFDSVWTEPIPDDPVARCNVFALKRGKSRKTVVLTGHFDVVPTDNYGNLESLAFDAEALLPAIIHHLKQTGDHPLALADFESGDFIPGRGLLDMKAGLAAGLAAHEAYAGDGTVLFLAVSDEEDRSAGMRAAAPLLKKVAADEKLDIRLVINLDAISDQGDGTQGRVAALGSIGKQLLTAFVVGKEAHACYPEDGINAAYLAAELLTEFEMAPELSEKSGHEVAAPPTALHAKDLKSGYNVTTPAQSWLYWNTLQHRRSAADVILIAQDLARRTMARVKSRFNRDVPVMTYAELAARLPKGALDGKARDIALRTELDLPERSKLLTSHAWSLSGLSGPAVILGFGSIPYPAVSVDDPGLEALIAKAVQPHGVGLIRYFPGISDMSFLGKAPGSGDAANTPLADSSFVLPEPAGYPVINIGPWGRDYHHWLERLHAPYAFDVLPKVLRDVMEAVLEKD
jgi:arginine utilization protein RocB